MIRKLSQPKRRRLAWMRQSARKPIEKATIIRNTKRVRPITSESSKESMTRSNYLRRIHWTSTFSSSRTDPRPHTTTGETPSLRARSEGGTSQLERRIDSQKGFTRYSRTSSSNSLTSTRCMRRYTELGRSTPAISGEPRSSARLYSLTRRGKIE